MVYSTLLSLPQSYFENPYNVMIIPAFSLAESVLNPENCTGLRPCVEKSLSSSWLRNRALTLYPQTREELVDCLNKNRCEFFRPYTKTHVSILHILHFRTIFQPTGQRFPRMCLTLPFPASERSTWSPTACWRERVTCLSSMSVSSTMVATRYSGLSIFVTEAMSSTCFLTLLLRICRIHRILGEWIEWLDPTMPIATWMGWERERMACIGCTEDCYMICVTTRRMRVASCCVFLRRSDVIVQQRQAQRNEGSEV